MDREILFRGKRAGSGEWIDGNLFITPYNEYLITSPNNDFFNAQPCNVIPETVGQFTGLTDKNGIKIFEGDIVEFQDGIPDDIYHEIEITNRGVMAFSAGQFYVTERNVVDMKDLIWDNADFDGEVVGNIHDNPELLKGD